MITIRVNGEDFVGFTEVGLLKSIDTICDQFSITCTADQRFAFPIPRGAEIQFIIEDIVEFTGTVEIIDGEYSSGSYSISAKGRDKTKALLKTDLRPKSVIKGPIQLKKLMERTLSAHDIDIDVINEAGTLKELTNKEILTSETGSKIYDFFNPLGSKRQVLITKNRDGNLVLLKPNQNKYNMILRSKIFDPDKQNNILEANFTFDDSERVREYNVYSQANLTVPGSESPPDPDTGEIVARKIVEWSRTKGTAIDNAISDGEHHRVADDPSDNDECERLAKWDCNNARVAATRYTCSVSELLIDNDTWQTGYLIDVIDEIADIDSTMLISGVEYISSKTSDGKVDEMVNLTLTIPDGFGDNASASDSDIQINRIGGNWNEGNFQ